MAGTSGRSARRGPRSPFVIDISRLGRRPGSMQEISETVPSPVRIGMQLVVIERDTPVDLDLTLQSVSEGVVVTGTVSAPTAGECGRCLTPVTGEVEIDLTEMYAYPDSVTEATTEDDEVGHVVDDTVDLEQPIIDAIGLALPFTPLCSPDCPGLCPDCGTPLADAGPEHHHDKIDPRWAKLSAMLPDQREPASEADGGGA